MVGEQLTPSQSESFGFLRSAVGTDRTLETFHWLPLSGRHCRRHLQYALQMSHLPRYDHERSRGQLAYVGCVELDELAMNVDKIPRSCL